MPTMNRVSSVVGWSVGSSSLDYSKYICNDVCKGIRRHITCGSGQPASLAGNNNSLAVACAASASSGGMEQQ